MAAADPLEQLQKLAELRDAGVITEVEFDAKKSDLLSLVGLSPAQHRGHASTVFDAAIGASGIPSFDSVNADRIEQLREPVLAAQSELRQLAGAARKTKRTNNWLSKRLAVVNGILRLRQNELLAGPIGLTAILTTLTAALTTAITSFATLETSHLLRAWIVGMAIGLAISTLLFIPSDLALARQRIALSQRISYLGTLAQQYIAQRANVELRLREVEATYRSAVAIFKSREYQLLNCQWRLFKGTDFENFLQLAFECRGYAVTATGRSGDQGADLIIEKHGCRIVVQAKGYSGNVSNAAVQQAFTAMAFYGCQRCAVVTNSEFTASAMEVAERTGCRLIDWEQIPKLIVGDVAI